MKKSTYYLWKFTFVNTVTCEMSPLFLCLGTSASNAENRMRKYFPKNYWKVESCMCIKSKDIIVVPAFSSINLEEL